MSEIKQNEEQLSVRDKIIELTGELEDVTAFFVLGTKDGKTSILSNFNDTAMGMFMVLNQGILDEKELAVVNAMISGVVKIAGKKEADKEKLSGVSEEPQVDDRELQESAGVQVESSQTDSEPETEGSVEEIND